MNLAREAGASVWGAVFRIDEAEIAALDRFEPGYSRIPVSVNLRAGGACEAQTYLCEQRETGLRAAPWYKALMLAGAREHALPDAWIAFLASLPVGHG